MLDVLVIIALLFAVAIFGILAAAALKPQTFHIERSIAIDAPAAKVFPLIDNVRIMNGWNPFAKSDPLSKITYSGPEDGKGAAYDWESMGKTGIGRLEITNSVPASSVDMRLVMQKPMPCDNRIRFSLVPTGTVTKVTWAMSGPWPYIHRVIGTVINTDKMVGREFERGLRDLKAIAET
jgi:hypothetical protein